MNVERTCDVAYAETDAKPFAASCQCRQRTYLQNAAARPHLIIGVQLSWLGASLKDDTQSDRLGATS